MQETPFLRCLTSPAPGLKSAFHGHRNQEGGGDAARRRRPRAVAVTRRATSDNPGAESGPEARINAPVMRLARMLGRRIAREELDRLDAANGNALANEAGKK